MITESTTESVAGARRGEVTGERSLQELDLAAEDSHSVTDDEQRLVVLGHRRPLPSSIFTTISQRVTLR